MQPKIITLPYQPNAILKYFAPLSDKPWSILLHSGYTNRLDGRFDILVSDPVVTLVTYNGITKICRDGNCRIYNEDPFLLVQQQLEEFKDLYISNFNLPFQGGAVGFFGYDLVRKFEKIPVQSKRDLTFPEMFIGIYNWSIIADHYLRTVTIVSYDGAILPKLLNQHSNIVTSSFCFTGAWSSNMNREQYGEKFKKIQDYLKNGICYQICLAQRFSASCNDGNRFAMFNYLLQRNKSPFSAFIRLEDQVIMSFSPERFLFLQNNHIQSRPIKGTIHRSKNFKDDQKQIKKLLNSEKDQSENLMIVDLIRNDIGRVAQPGSVDVPCLFSIETFSTVHHMVSTVTAMLSHNFTPFDLLRSCFPGGSITGAPKLQAMKIIEDLEPHRRYVWCGSIGYISCCGRMDTNIAIRTILIDENNAYCYVGSGIVFDSNEELEYKETLAKASSLISF